MDNSLQEIMNNTLDNLKGIVQSEDMIFKPIYIDNNTMAIPLSIISSLTREAEAEEFQLHLSDFWSFPTISLYL